MHLRAYLLIVFHTRRKCDQSGMQAMLGHVVGNVNAAIEQMDSSQHVILWLILSGLNIA